MISLDLYGDPVSQARPRIYARGNSIRAWNPNHEEKERCKWQIRSQYRDDPIQGPVFLDLVFFMPIPKGTSGIKRRQMLNGMVHHMKRPDIDNLQKFVFDCLNQIVINDDSQIVEVRSRKVYSEKPGTSLRITELNKINLGVDYEDFRSKRA